LSLFALGHPLATLNEGATAVIDGAPHPMPLEETRFHVDVRNGLATITATRVLMNKEDKPIEVLLTMPAPFEAVMTGLSAVVDGRRLSAVAQGREKARATYEDATDRGKLAVLHEEPMRGIHMLSVSQLAPGRKVEVVAEMVMPLALQGDRPFLRLPLTVGEIYGHSPFLPADDIAVDPNLHLEGNLSISKTSGRAVFASGDPADGDTVIALGRSLELFFPDQRFGTVEGRDSAGRQVQLKLSVPRRTAKTLDIAILFDRSGSTNSQVGSRGLSVHEAMKLGLGSALSTLKGEDHVDLWEFDNQATPVKLSRGEPLALNRPGGGTELGRAVSTALAHRATPILVLTDGQTYATEVQATAARGAPIFAVLVGDESLDAMIGHLAASTGGQVFAAAGDDVAPAIVAALDAMRRGSASLDGEMTKSGPRRVSTMRGGIAIVAEWSNRKSDHHSDAAGRYAAAIALPLFKEDQAATYAIAHGLSGHLTSLVLVDEAGSANDALPRTRKVPLASARNFVATDFFMDVAAHQMGVRQSPASKSSERVRILLLDSPSASNAEEVAPPIHINWSTLAGALINRDHEAWPSDLLEFMAEAKENHRIQEIVRATGLDLELVVLLLLAYRDSKHNRNAARVARRLAKGLSSEAIKMIENERCGWR
jgi:Vault protein inter-alpha-trypsin domain